MQSMVTSPMCKTFACVVPVALDERWSQAKGGKGGGGEGDGGKGGEWQQHLDSAVSDSP